MQLIETLASTKLLVGKKNMKCSTAGCGSVWSLQPRKQRALLKMAYSVEKGLFSNCKMWSGARHMDKTFFSGKILHAHIQ
jgi:hypothetical protein